MAHEERRPPRRDRRKRPILVILFSLLPLFIGVGILAPGMVTVMAVEGEQLERPSVRITRRLSRYAHQPLLLPRDFSAGFIPELLDLEHLFSRVDYMADPTVRERARLPSFPRDFGDVIVLDDVDQRLREIVFKDPVLFSRTIASAYPPPAADLLPLGGTGPIGPGPRFDDYFGPELEPDDEVVVPEPSTGLMLVMGLTLLAIVGRNRRETGLR
jgi:hypothetical protein